MRKPLIRIQLWLVNVGDPKPGIKDTPMEELIPSLGQLLAQLVKISGRILIPDLFESGEHISSFERISSLLGLHLNESVDIGLLSGRIYP